MAPDENKTTDKIQVEEGERVEIKFHTEKYDGRKVIRNFRGHL